ncbi:MAG TPA: D-alanyl-D-alanine carboxypeptidase [Thermomonospora sp.]|nr:D-alanyl-D-alanine carboxypeptidase [Thermomonospora sp.]
MRREPEVPEQVFWEAPAARPVVRPEQGGGLPALPPVEDFPQPPAVVPEFRTFQQEAVGRHRMPALEAPVAEVPALEAPAGAVPLEEAGRRRRRWPLAVVLTVVVLLVAAVAVQLVRPLPEPTLHSALPASYTFEGARPALPLPQRGQAVIGVEGVGTMGTAGAETPIPTASVAKVMTAYVFLKNHPLRSGEDGPTFTISAQEAARLRFRKQRGESHVDVRAGQRFTERKALEALMVVSANNIAHELARWDAGSIPAYVAKMNAAARELGMTNTRYTDPSGYDSGTVSTAADQVKLLRAAMAMPAFAEVVAQRTYVPNDGGPVRPAGNILLGQYGIVGGKTGYTDAAGGNFVFAARRKVAGVDTLMIGAVMGQQGTSAVAAMTVAQRLTAAAQGALTGATLVQEGQRAGEIRDGLGGRTPVAAARPVTVVGWPGLTVRVGVDGNPPSSAPRGEEVGAVVVGDGMGRVRFPLRLPQNLAEPDLMTRLTRLG